MLRRRKGQSILEYALIIAVIVGALIAMQIFLKRSVQGKLRDSIDDIGGGGQYAAGHVNSNFVTVQGGSYVTNETFGMDAAGAFSQGQSNYVVVEAPTMNTYATEAAGGAEKIDTSYNAENLLP